MLQSELVETPKVVTKRPYVAPTVELLGTFAEITQATNKGLFIDGSYPAHTPIAGHIS
jgi:hypothetical protein